MSLTYSKKAKARLLGPMNRPMLGLTVFNTH